MIDLSSDTATLPTKAMKKFMIAAELGDEQKKEDPTTRKLEEMVADLLGLDDALFLPSATMANQIAIRMLCSPGDQLIGAENCHIFTSESGGLAIHSGIIPKPISMQSGIFTSNDIHRIYEKTMRITQPKMTCITIENTTNLGGGLAWDTESLHSVISFANKYKLSLHLDGSRLFNATAKYNINPKSFTKNFNTVTLCLSKGLGCPIGAILAFKKKYAEKAFYLKQLFGGRMRQSGIIAAAGIYALQNHVDRMIEDQQNAEYFSKRISEEIPNINVETDPRSTNMTFFSWQGKNLNTSRFYEFCLKNGVQFSEINQNRFRAVFHLSISRNDVRKVIDIMKKLPANKSIRNI